MRWLLFLSRLAFISGICILVWLILAMVETDNTELFSSTVIIIGYALGAVILPVTNICYLIVVMMGKKLRAAVPMWLIIANIFFLILLIYYIFYLNDPYYHQE
ncbi:hypothetical protein CAP36_14625 [Chitinophagaceae bacterium IBVUCB2]|nr:hypothetical protein CAP36_14625 [Chitinophagaceae bacterium IBVUCB2]